MSYDGSGVYSLPAGNPVTTGTIVSSTWANSTLSDIATALTNALTKDGQSTPTGNIKLGSYKLTGLGAATADGDALRYQQLFSQGAPTDIASAATCDIGAVRSNFLTVTGTTTITSLGTNYNGPKMLRFSGALTLTYNATTLLLPGTQSITTVAGDMCIVVPKSTVSGTADGWAVISYTRASGESYLPVAFGGYRNRLINGNMLIDQEHAGAAQTITAGAALAYTVDQWYAYSVGGNATGQQITASDSTKRYQITGGASVSSIGFCQRIESKNCLDLAGSTCTLSAKLKNSLLTTVSWVAYYANSADAFGTIAGPTKTSFASGSFTVTSSEVTYSVQISVPAAAVTGIEIAFTVAAQISGTWVIGDVQFEKGAIPLAAITVERPDYAAQLLRCQRYYFKTFSQGTAPVQGLGSTAGALLVSTNAASLFGGSLAFPTTMFASPSVLTTYNPQLSSANANWRDTNNAADRTLSAIAGNDAGVAVTGAAGVVNGLNYIHLTAAARIP